MDAPLMNRRALKMQLPAKRALVKIASLEDYEKRNELQAIPSV
jgi:hypothetical protein